MKTITIIALQFALILSSSFYGFAQLTVVNEPQTPSVQASEMTKYGKQDVNLYTGELSLNIPLCVYRDEDFTIPVSLSYSYNGLKVNQQAGIAGLGWSLVFGGYITREVRGIPDESRSSMVLSAPSAENSVNLFGYNYNNYYPQNGISAQPLYNGMSPKNLLNIFYQRPSDLKYFEATSDIYHFSFLGHSGSFVKDSNTGKYKVYHTSTFDGNYTIVRDEDSDVEQQDPYSGGFTITTADGYKYHFGSYDPHFQLQDALEREMTLKDDGTKEFKPGTITAWALRSITAPNGRYVIFKYENGFSEGETPSCVISYNTSLWYYSENEADSQISFSESYSSYLLPYSLSINGDDVLTFQYSDKPSDSLGLYINGNNGPVSIRNSQTYPLLTGISGLGCVASLRYVYNRSGSPNPFLSAIEIDSLGTYRFQYNGLETGYFPPLATTAKDHWGYSNKTVKTECDNNYITYSNLFTNSGLTESLSSYRNPNFAASSLGLMLSVTYPTGGSSSFEWEPNFYTSKIAKTAENSFIPSQVSDSGEGPGGRIKKIVNHGQDGTTVDSVVYIYEKYLQNGHTTGSGTLIISPRYSINYSGTLYKDDNTPLEVNKSICLYSDGSVVAFDGIPVEYSEVEQVFSDGSKTRTRFTSFDSGFPDYFPTNPASIPVPRLYQYLFDGLPVYLSVSQRQSITNILLPPVSLQWRRGRILSQEIHDSSSAKLRETLYSYAPAPQRLDAYEYIYVGEAAAHTYKMANDFHQSYSLTRDFLGEKTGSFYSGSSYNSLGLKIADTITTISGEKTITEYLYVSDKYASGATLSPAEDSMRVAGWYSFPLEVKTTSLKDQVETLISHDRYTYRKIAGSDSLNFKPVVWEKKDVESGQWYTFATYKYDKFGRMIQKTNANGISTVYVWSTEHLGPSLRIDNATISDVSSVISGCFYSTGNTNVQYRASILKTQLPQSAVSWFSWYEYGMPEEVGDPSGRVTHYTYDMAKRLHLVTDDGRNPAEKYDYQTSTRQE